MNLRAYAYEPAPAAGPHRALGPQVEGQVFYRASQLPYGSDYPQRDALESPKATLWAPMRQRGREGVEEGEAGPQLPPSQPLWRF